MSYATILALALHPRCRHRRTRRDLVTAAASGGADGPGGRAGPTRQMNHGAGRIVTGALALAGLVALAWIVGSAAGLARLGWSR